jgi:hypothetical protein
MYNFNRERLERSSWQMKEVREVNIKQFLGKYVVKTAGCTYPLEGSWFESK